ncbi:unnamed protein product [Protopolystoma xenopodis]|uniref:Uncharacterized protein n=1 Tax=Protopolystoma xenopodis TaxID=117903 RepID=A0A3S5C3C0_9PLAT|nr:unnamed protein product [Protopolystoma xenopodis]
MSVTNQEQDDVSLSQLSLSGSGGNIGVCNQKSNLHGHIGSHGSVVGATGVAIGYDIRGSGGGAIVGGTPQHSASGWPSGLRSDSPTPSQLSTVTQATLSTAHCSAVSGSACGDSTAAAAVLRDPAALEQEKAERAEDERQLKLQM